MEDSLWIIYVYGEKEKKKDIHTLGCRSVVGEPMCHRPALITNYYIIFPLVFCPLGLLEKERTAAEAKPAFPDAL